MSDLVTTGAHGALGLPARLHPVGRAVRNVVLSAWAVVLVAIARQPLYVSHDSVSNYAHVWYIGERIRTAHRIPFHVPMLAGGHAFAYPYAFVPWTLAALVRLLVGDWAVTAFLILGFVATVRLVFAAFPELRTPWCVAAVLANPALVMAVLVGQIPFLWAVAFLFAAIACWRRRHRWAATSLGALAMATHPAVLIPLTVLVVVAYGVRAGRHGGLWWRTALAVAVALPAGLVVVRSPAVTQTTTWFRVEQLGRIVASRGTVVALPFVLLALRRSRRPVLPAVFVVVGGLNAVLLGPMNRYAWAAPFRRPDERINLAIDSPDFRPGDTYRVLGFADGRVSMYRLIQHGARLDGEFFPESQARHSWNDLAAYERFLLERRVDAVVAWQSYDARWHTNEHELLRRLAARASCQGPVTVSLRESYPGYDVYDVHPC